MAFKFIAVNGDNVGEGIGNAIVNDDHEGLSNITSKLKDAHGGIEQWVQSLGGEVVTASGDEGIYKIPLESFNEDDLENVKNQYTESAGNTITIGIGDSMLEASKALIYGKLNDKDQIVHYDSHIDDYISEEEDGVDATDQVGDRGRS